MKFCGLTRADDARCAARLGAAYAGVIFAGGPRERTPAQAAEIHAAATPAAAVGVFGADFRERIPRVLAATALAVVQLHADPTPKDVAAARTLHRGAVWAVVRVAGTTLPDQAAALFRAADAVVLDARASSGLGGTGVALDWRGLAAAVGAVRGNTPLVLAGGLRAENVREAIAALAPQVVDVSSGVESAPGIKDHDQMAAFAAAVRGPLG